MACLDTSELQTSFHLLEYVIVGRKVLPLILLKPTPKWFPLPQVVEGLCPNGLNGKGFRLPRWNMFFVCWLQFDLGWLG